VPSYQDFMSGSVGYSPMMFTAFKGQETRFAQELSRRVPAKVCADIAAMSRNLDLPDPRWLCHVLGDVQYQRSV
jgi:hypothetical protein